MRGTSKVLLEKFDRSKGCVRLGLGKDLVFGVATDRKAVRGARVHDELFFRCSAQCCK